MMAATSWPWRSSAMEIAKIGMPCRKLVVPSSGSTIQRCWSSSPGDGAALLHQERVAGPRAGELGVDDLLGLAVGLADIVAGTLERDLQVLHLAEIAGQRAAGLVGGLHHDVEDR